MKHKEIKKKLKEEMNLQVPDVFDNILLQCKDKEIIMKEKMKSKKRIFLYPSLAAAVFLFIFGFIFYNGYQQTTIIEFDVNPSIQLEVNQRKQIKKANALNEDGKKILNGMNLIHSDLNVGVNAIIGSMLKEGYLSELKNSILVSVDSKNKKEGEALQKSLTEEIDKILNTYSITSSVITQEYQKTNTVETQAKEAGVSEGKMVFINKILESGLQSKNGTAYTVETLSKLNIQELKAILESKNKTVQNTTSTGKASTAGYVGTVKAKQIALDHSKVAENNIRDLEIELDYEYGKLIYEVSFDANAREYEYEIDAITGEIIHHNAEVDDDRYQTSNNTRPATQNSNNTTNTTNTNNTTTYIGNSKAIQVALSNAGLSSNAVRDLECELDYEYGKAIYEVSFQHQRTEYDYEIDAISGSIIHKNTEYDD